jgi:hypothetical protein
MSHDRIEPRQDITPRRVTESRRSLGGTDNIDEEDRRQKAIGHDPSPGASHEFFDFTEYLLLDVRPPVCVPGKFYEASAGDPVRQISPRFDVRDGISSPMHDQSRNPNGWQNAPYVNLTIQLLECRDG